MVCVCACVHAHVCVWCVCVCVLQKGDVVEVEIEDIGTLTNKVV